MGINARNVHQLAAAYAIYVQTKFAGEAIYIKSNI